MNFTFLHAADIHLDSPMIGLSRYEGAPVDTMRRATRDAFVNMVSLAIDEAVAFVVIAGDLFDTELKDMNSGLFFAAQMARLNEVNIPVYILHGNHDAKHAVTKTLPLPDNVHVFSSRKATSVQVPDLPVVLHGHSFAQREVMDNLAEGYPDAVPNRFNIGVLHTALEGHARHANYAPCTVQQLVAKGYGYWALGHVHEYAVMHDDPPVVFSGNLQGRNIRETGAKGCVLVTVEDGRAIHTSHRSVDVARWVRLSVDITSCEQLEDALNRVREALTTALDEADDRLLAVRIDLTGKTHLHSPLTMNMADVVNQIRALALQLGVEQAWVEKVKIATSPRLDPEALAARQDAVADLDQSFAMALSDEDFLAGLKQELGLLTPHLSPDVMGDMPGKPDPEELDLIDHLQQGDLATILAKARTLLTSNLTEEG